MWIPESLLTSFFFPRPTVRFMEDTQKMPERGTAAAECCGCRRVKVAQ